MWEPIDLISRNNLTIYIYIYKQHDEKTKKFVLEQQGNSDEKKRTYIYIYRKVKMRIRKEDDHNVT